MENNQNTPNQVASDSPAQRSPEVMITTSNDEVPTNKPNPNMVMALVLCFMLIIGLALAFYFKGDAGVNGDDSLAEKQKLERMIASERSGSSPDIRASAAALEGRISSILENTHALQSEFTMMRAGYTDANEKLARAGNEVQGNMNTISRLGSENTALKNQILQLQQLARNAQAYQSQAQAYAKSNAEKDAVIASLQGRPSNESVQQLRKNLSSEQMSKLELATKLKALENRMASMVDAGEANQNEARLAALQEQNDELRRQLQALQTNVDFGKLFVKSYTTLPENAQALYGELNKLEGYSEEKLRREYTRIATELNAENLQQVKFATGSSILNFTDQTKIKAKLDTTDRSDYFLVVGYASKTGDASSNETLSAKRATAVASVVNQLKKQGQDVRAVYLGQTNRFSKSVNADNQLCEIWRIRD